MFEIELISNFLKDNDLEPIDYTELVSRFRKLYPNVTSGYITENKHGYKIFSYRKGSFKTSVMLGRLWMQLYHDNVLDNYDTHHDDENKHNNKLSNLEIKSKDDHTKGHRKYLEQVEFICSKCKNKFYVDRLDARRFTYRVKFHFNIYCNTTCSRG